MFDNHSIKSMIKTLANTNPRTIFNNSILCLKDMKNDGFASLIAGKDDKGSIRVFVPGWSLLYSCVIVCGLIINVAVSGLVILITKLLSGLIAVLDASALIISCIIALPLAYFVRAVSSDRNMLTKFGMKITKVKK